MTGIRNFEAWASVRRLCGPRTLVLQLASLLVLAIFAGTAAAVDVDFDRTDLGPTARQVPDHGKLRVRGVRLKPGAAASDLSLERFQAFTADAVVHVHTAQGERTERVPELKKALGL